MSKSSAFALSALALIGSSVILTAKDDSVTKYTISGLHEDKMGTMKDKSKELYVTMVNDDDNTDVLNLHPQQAATLFKNGQQGDFTLMVTAPVDNTTVVVDNVIGAVEGTVEGVVAEGVVADVVNSAEVTNVDTSVHVGDSMTVTTVVTTTVAPTAVVDTAPVDLAAAQTAAFVAPQLDPNAVATAPVVKLEPSKKMLALPVFIAGVKAKKEPGAIQKEFISKLGMTKAGASTYYYAFKAGKWGAPKFESIVVDVVATAPVVTAVEAVIGGVVETAPVVETVEVIAPVAEVVAETAPVADEALV